MADARVKAVLPRLVDTYSRQDYVFRNVFNVSNDVGFGDVIELPYDTAPDTVAGGTRAAPTAANPSIATLTVDQFPSKRRLHPRIDEIQLLGAGSVVVQRAQLFTADLMAEADDYLCGIISTAAAAGALEEINPTGAVALSDFYDAESQILDQDGVRYENLMMVYAPSAIPQIKGFFDPPRANQGPNPAAVGVPGIQTINGIPAVMSRSAVLPTSTTDPACLLFDRTKVFWAEQAMPEVKFVDDAESMSTVLQVGMIYGATIIPGYARAINCAAS